MPSTLHYRKKSTASVGKTFFKLKQKLFKSTQKFIRASVLYFQVRSSKIDLVELSRTFYKLSDNKPLLINLVSPNLSPFGNYDFYSSIDQITKVIFIGVLLKKFICKKYKKKIKKVFVKKPAFPLNLIRSPKGRKILLF